MLGQNSFQDRQLAQQVEALAFPSGEARTECELRDTTGMLALAAKETSDFG